MNNNIQSRQSEIEQAFSSVWKTVCTLRAPQEGCPWDKEQTHQSLLRYLIEEAYEYCHAVRQHDTLAMKNELGDVLFQVLLHACLAQEKNTFSIDDICQHLQTKLIRRHPHVFNRHEGDSTLTPAQVKQQWDQIKKSEKKNTGGQVSLLGDAWKSSPSLMGAFLIGEKTQQCGFDWDDHKQVVYKVEEEWQELKEELSASAYNQERVREEIGDLLFTTAQLARHLGIEPEECLQAANQKFVGRFEKMEILIQQDKKNIEEMNQTQMDFYWNKVKMKDNTAWSNSKPI